jgi:hypothetical protein
MLAPRLVAGSFGASRVFSVIWNDAISKERGSGYGSVLKLAGHNQEVRLTIRKTKATSPSPCDPVTHYGKRDYSVATDR